MPTKICNACHKKLPLDAFHTDKSKKDGISSICKKCNNSKTRVCLCCGQTKPSKEFSIQAKLCLECEKRFKRCPTCGEIKPLNQSEIFSHYVNLVIRQSIQILLIIEPVFPAIYQVPLRMEMEPGLCSFDCRFNLPRSAIAKAVTLAVPRPYPQARSQPCRVSLLPNWRRCPSQAI